MFFTSWLKRQIERDDPVGDLARDVKLDKQFPRGSNSYRRIESYLISSGACSGARSSLRKAWTEYQKSQDPTRRAGVHWQEVECERCGDSFMAPEKYERQICDSCLTDVMGGSTDAKEWSLDDTDESRVKGQPVSRQPIAPADRWATWERDDFTCRRCGSRRNLSVDHIIPVSRGGPSSIDNYQTLCRSCNSSKGARL